MLSIHHVSLYYTVYGMWRNLLGSSPVRRHAAWVAEHFERRPSGHHQRAHQHRWQHCQRSAQQSGKQIAVRPAAQLTEHSGTTRDWGMQQCLWATHQGQVCLLATQDSEMEKGQTELNNSPRNNQHWVDFCPNQTFLSVTNRLILFSVCLYYLLCLENDMIDTLYKRALLITETKKFCCNSFWIILFSLSKYICHLWG